jgi:phosphonate metabolism protein PhnN/1,5-bisphosphokinase (PRPP-forming)
MPAGEALAGMSSAGAPGEGALIVIVGASGSGKDTLINWLREKLETRPDILFVRRTVTRTADSGLEDHDTMSEADFGAAEAAGRFSVTWNAHGLRYGLPAAVHDHMRGGGIAIANGSRKALPDIRAQFGNLSVIHLTVDTDVLAERLAARGRESAAEIKGRLERAAMDHDIGPGDVELDNSGPIHIAGNRVVSLLEEHFGRKTHIS